MKKLQETKIAWLIDELPSEIFIIDAVSLKCSHINHCALANLGYTTEEFLSRPPENLVQGFQRQRFRS